MMLYQAVVHSSVTPPRSVAINPLLENEKQHDRISLTQSKPYIYHIHSSQNSAWPTFFEMTNNSAQALMTFFIHFSSYMKTLADL